MTNNGPSAAQNVVLTDATPEGTSFVALNQVLGTAFTCSTPAVGAAGPASCTTATLPLGATAVFTFAVRMNLPDTGTITNTASIATSTIDPQLDNNTSAAGVTVSIRAFKQNVLADLVALFNSTITAILRAACKARLIA